MKTRPIFKTAKKEMALAWCGEYELFEIKNITAKYLHAAGCSSAKVREGLQHEN